jgi:hypothetical protein
MIQQYIPPPQLPEYPRYCAESAAALLKDLAGNLDTLAGATVRDGQAIRRALLDVEYLSRHIRQTLERG